MKNKDGLEIIVGQIWEDQDGDKSVVIAFTKNGKVVTESWEHCAVCVRSPDAHVFHRLISCPKYGEDMDDYDIVTEEQKRDYNVPIGNVQFFGSDGTWHTHNNVDRQVFSNIIDKPYRVPRGFDWSPYKKDYAPAAQKVEQPEERTPEVGEVVWCEHNEGFYIVLDDNGAGYDWRRFALSVGRGFHSCSSRLKDLRSATPTEIVKMPQCPSCKGYDIESIDDEKAYQYECKCGVCFDAPEEQSITSEPCEHDYEYVSYDEFVCSKCENTLNRVGYLLYVDGSTGQHEPTTTEPREIEYPMASMDVVELRKRLVAGMLSEEEIQSHLTEHQEGEDKWKCEVTTMLNDLWKAIDEMRRK